MANNPDDKQHYLDKPANVQRLLNVFYVICALLFAADFVIHRHTKIALEEFPAFYAVFGFVAFCVLVIGSIGLRKLVMRKEDYYDVDD
ncbi:MAG: hypothetical protein KJO10_08840 [Gammaproteobacteria bacterium]|nr:hypothetical protein [Gammaproteobacteria bacterium]